MAGCVETGQVLWIMAEVGVHLKDVLVAMAEGPFEARDVGGAQAPLAATLNDKQAASKLGVHQPVYYLCGTIGAAVVDNQDVETFGEGKHGTDNLLDVLLLVICGDNYNAIAGSHII